MPNKKAKKPITRSLKGDFRCMCVSRIRRMLQLHDRSHPAHHRWRDPRRISCTRCMSQRIQQHDPSPNVPSRGRAFTYVLPCRDEDILKIGFSRDPLARLHALHPRYFDFFDTGRAFLIETDHVRDARRLERELASGVAEHRAPSPLVVPRNAAGHTEWFRGAYDRVADAAAIAVAKSGYVHHASLQAWLSRCLSERSDRLFEWSLQLLDAILIQRPLDAELARPLECLLLDRLDEYAAAGLSVESLVADDVRDWYRLQRPGIGCPRSAARISAICSYLFCAGAIPARQETEMPAEKRDFIARDIGTLIAIVSRLVEWKLTEQAMHTRMDINPTNTRQEMTRQEIIFTAPARRKIAPAKTRVQRIDLRDRRQVDHWCRYLGATRFQLFSAVDQFGNEVAAVQRALRLR